MPLEPVIIDLWVWSLDDVGEIELNRLGAFLSEDEWSRAERFVFDKDRNRFVAGRGRLREILGQTLSRDPSDVRFAYQEHGKPVLASSCTPQFNLAHSGGIAALGVSKTLALGVDVEFVRPLSENVAEAFFSQREIEQLAALPVADKLPGFYRCWTRKEALVKAIGAGLSLPGDHYDVSVSADKPPIVERLEGETDASEVWRLAHFVPTAGFVGAVACRTGGAPLSVIRHDNQR